MRWLVILSAAVVLSGCWYTQVTDGMIATRSLDFDKAHRVDYSRKVCAYDRTHILCIIPTGQPSPQEAVDLAIDEIKSKDIVVGLASAVVRRRWFYIPYIYGQMWYSAEGYPIYEIEKPKAEPKKPAKENGGVRQKESGGVIQQDEQKAVPPRKVTNEDLNNELY